MQECCNGRRMRHQPLIQTSCLLPATHCAAILAYVIFNRSCGSRTHRNCLKTTQHHIGPRRSASYVRWGFGLDRGYVRLPPEQCGNECGGQVVVVA